MEHYKVLNLYAGIGGNRKLWENVEVTAVEHNDKIAKVYQALYPNDKVILADAHQYLLDHSDKFDFIWSSPPCPTHTRLNTVLNSNGIKRYPDMRLYQEILYLTHFFKGKFCVENVISYYEPLIRPQIAGRHYYWANFIIQPFNDDSDFNLMNLGHGMKTSYTANEDNLERLQKYVGIDISNFDVPNKLLLLRNCVKPSLGLHIFNCAFKTIQMGLNDGTL